MLRVIIAICIIWLVASLFVRSELRKDYLAVSNTKWRPVLIAGGPITLIGAIIGLIGFALICRNLESDCMPS